MNHPAKRFAVLVAAISSTALLGACAYQEPAPYYAQPAPPQYQAPYQPAPPIRGSVAADRGYNVGVITSIEGMRAEQQRVSPVGAIAGAVIGGLLGNQVGAGNGKALATGAGVVGGALAGNEIGRRAEAGGAPDVYRVGIQYNNGGTQYIDVRDPSGLRVGERVSVDGNGQISRY